MINRQPRWARCLIIGHSDDIPAKPPVVDGHTLIIAADAGYLLAQKWGLVPHWLLGDFDSLDPHAVGDFPPEQIIRHPVEKDKTDLELAVDYALTFGVGEIIMTGVWGGRVDHSLGNIELMYKLAGKNIEARILTGSAELHLVNQSLKLDLPVDTVVSLLPLSAEVSGVTTRGLYYHLRDAVIKKGSTWTISNKAAARSIEIKCGTGVLLVVVIQKDPR